MSRGKCSPPERTNLSIPDPSSWDDVGTALPPEQEPPAPPGPTAAEPAAFLNGMRGPALRRYWTAVLWALDPPVRASLRQCLGAPRPAP